METSIVKVEHLSHRYSVQWAIRDIHLEIKENGVYGLLGSNGAGKSTLMNIMCGVLKQTEGNVYIKGIDMLEHPIEAKRQIGFLPQQAPLHKDLTVCEYLSYCAKIRHVERRGIRQAVERVMELCGVAHFKDRLITNLSGGYQQRVGIAQAIVHDPALVIFDEPTNGLDPNQITDMRHLIQRIAQNRTVILSTHILSEVQAICSSIFMIEQGTLIFSGTLQEFCDNTKPVSLLVSLIATPSRDELLAIPGVTDVEELGGTHYRLRFSTSEGIMERVVETSMRQGWRLNELRYEKESLNAIFAQMSKNKNMKQ